jgi:hypothetical protein
MTQNTPAFPQPDCGHGRPYESGMSLRDYFAAKAMQGLLSSDVYAPVEKFAKQAYVMADEMLKARES